MSARPITIAPASSDTTSPAIQAIRTSGRPQRTRGRPVAGTAPGAGPVTRRVPGSVGRGRGHGQRVRHGSAPVVQAPTRGDTQPVGVALAEVVPGGIGVEACVEPHGTGAVVVSLE